MYAIDAEKGYNDLLLRPDIAAVIIALPIVIQPEYVEAALAAGKHVLAEKPIAKDVATAKQLLNYYRNGPPSFNGATLVVAENYRFVPRLTYARNELQRLGRITHFSVKVMSLMSPGAKWLGTKWRREPEYQGGFLLDGGVHYAAATRLFLRGDSDKADSVRAWTDRVTDFLNPIDTVTAIIKTASGATGTFQHSVGTFMEAFEWDIACEDGSVRSSADTVTVKSRLANGEVIKTGKSFDRSSGVPDEIGAWADSLLSGIPNLLQTPEEALADLEFLEKMFQSGEQAGGLQQYELQL